MKKPIDYHPGMAFPCDQIYIKGKLKYIVTNDVWVCGFLIKAGFIFDGNSVPRILYWLIARDDCFAAACLHDWIYSGYAHALLMANGLTLEQIRAYADSLWFSVRAAHGESVTRSTLGYVGLRIAGGGAKHFSRVACDFLEAA